MPASSAVAVVAAALIGLRAVNYAVDTVPDLLADTGPVVPAPPAPAKAGRSFIVVTKADPTATGKPVTGKPATGRATPTTSPPTARTTRVTPCATGVRHRELETALATLPDYATVVVDGRQSPTDCAVIRRFQQRFGIEPAAGQADATTADVASRIAASSTRSGQRQCATGPGITACVDLTRQTTWVVRDGTVVIGPTVIRTGFRGHPTPAGTYRINKRALQEWSDPYAVWLPYWQRFVGGIGFHQSITYLHDATLGSHGCVNLLPTDAAAMYDTLQIGTTVHTFGRRPGT